MPHVPDGSGLEVRLRLRDGLTLAVRGRHSLNLLPVEVRRYDIIGDGRRAGEQDVGMARRQVVGMAACDGRLRIIVVLNELRGVSGAHPIDPLNLLLLIGVLLYDIVVAAAEDLAVRPRGRELIRVRGAFDDLLLAMGLRRRLSLRTVWRRRIYKLLPRLPQVLITQVQSILDGLLR